MPLKKGACWRDLGTLSKDGKSTVKPFKWLPLADGKVKGAPDNNTHPDSSKLPPGDGRDPSKCIVPQCECSAQFELAARLLKASCCVGV